MNENKKYTWFEFMEKFCNGDFKIFGLSASNILNLKKEYLLRGGPIDKISDCEIVKIFKQ